MFEQTHHLADILLDFENEFLTNSRIFRLISFFASLQKNQCCIYPRATPAPHHADFIFHLTLTNQFFTDRPSRNEFHFSFHFERSVFHRHDLSSGFHFSFHLAQISIISFHFLTLHFEKLNLYRHGDIIFLANLFHFSLYFGKFLFHRFVPFGPPPH